MTEHFQPHRFSTLSLLLASLLSLACIFDCACAIGEEEFGPAKPQTVKTPFSMSDSDSSVSHDAGDLTSINIDNGPNRPLERRGIGQRLTQSRLYLPEKMVLGRVCDFTVKTKPGKWVAIAMADKDTGSKPVLGHTVRLGADRKVVAVAQVPASGVANLLVECPVEGDLVGSYLYFEAAIWSEDRIQDMELAQCVSTEGKSANFNGVLIQPQYDTKTGIRIRPTTTAPFQQTGQQQGLTGPHP